MRQAPPVSVLCHGRGWRQAQAAVYGLTAAALAAWAAQHLVAPADAAVLAIGLAAFLGVAGASWRRLQSSPVSLCWDGQQWSADGEPQAMGLMLHTDSFVLLRLRAASGTRWLAVARTEAGAVWHGLLVALHAPRSEPGPRAQGEGG